MGDITTRDGYLWHNARGDAMVVPPDSPRVNGDVPCLVVTGDLDTAKRRLDAPDDAAVDAIIADEFDPRDLDAPLVPRLIAAPTFGAIERAAREAQAQHVAWMREQGAQPRRATTWASLDDRTHDYWRQIARAALAAAEETPKRWRGTSVSELHDLYRRESRDAIEETPDA